MAIRDLFFAITARDRTAAAFNSVNANLRQTAGLSASIAERVDRMGNRMLRAGAAGSVASAGIFAAFRDSVGLYDEQARSEAKVAQAIAATGGAAGFTADQLRRQASELQGLTRFGDENILNNVTAQLLTFKNIAGDTFTRAQTAALDLATTLDGDLKGASIMLGKALNDPIAGISAMSRAGVTFTQAQKDMVKGMVESGDLLGAQTLILDEIAGAYGGQAQAARQAGAGIVEAWKNTWGDVKEIVGGQVLDALRVIVPILETITTAFQNMSPRGQRFVVVMGALAVAVPPVVAALGAMAIGLAAVSGPVGLVVLGLSAATAAVVTFWPEISALGGFLSGVLTAAFDMARQAVDGFVSGLAAVGSAVATAGQSILTLLNPFASLEDRISIFKAFWSGVWALIPEPIQGALISVADAIVSFLTPFDTASAAVTALGEVFRSVFGAIPRYVSECATAVMGWITDTFNAALQSLGEKVEWVEGKFAWLYDKVVGNSWVPDLIEEIGASFSLLSGNMVRPTDAAAESVNGTFKGLVGEVGSSLSDLVQSGNATWRGFMGSMLEVGANYADRIISDVFDRMADGMSSAFGGVSVPGAAGGAPAGPSGGSGGGVFGGIVGAGLGFARNLLGFDTGGEFEVPGRAGMDRNVARVRLSQGERVRVVKRGQSTDARPIVVNIHTPNPAAFQASRAQIGAQISRAAAAGSRGM